MRVVIRADAGPAIGAGHVVRCLALAVELRRAGAKTAFAMRSGSAASVAGFDTADIGIIDLPETGDDVAPLRAALEPNTDLLLVDHYDWTTEQETRCRKHVRRIAVIDDLANRKHDADLLLDQTPGRSERDYRDLLPPQCRFLLGPEYALLRPEFSGARPRSLERRRYAGRFEKVLISFGGVDSKNMTGKALDGISQSGLRLDTTVVMGARAPHLASVDAKVARMKASGLPIELRVNEDRMADLMAEADLAIGAVGGTAWERCALGLPTIAVSLADNQEGAATALAKAGAIEYLGRHGAVDAGAIAAALIACAGEPERLRGMSTKAASICDGSGARRAASAMVGLTA